MHICFLCNEYPPGKHGGVGSFTQTLARALVKRGIKVTAIGTYPIGSRVTEDDEGVQIIRLPHTRLKRMGFLVNGARLRRELAQIHTELPIDILEGPELSLAAVPAGFPAAKVIRMNGGHHFFAVTLGKKPRAWRSWLERRSFGRANHLCAVSSFVAETTRDLLHLNGRQIEILPNPVDTGFFRPRTEVKDERGLILFVGTVCEKKGVRQLIEAMPQIIKEMPDAKLQIVGRDWLDPHTDQSFINYLTTLIPLELKPHIVFSGPVEHSLLPGLIALSTVCVYPSHMEALPVAWLEGMAMGKAVVASKTGPGPEVIEDGVSGLLCDPHAPGSIAEKVITLLKSADLRREVGNKAQNRVRDFFSVDVLVDRNQNFYRRCIAEYNGA
jgi:glycosyltransferase involved in cell wall biosynthesis